MSSDLRKEIDGSESAEMFFERKIADETVKRLKFLSESKDLFTYQETAFVLGRSYGAIRNLVYRGFLKPVEILGRKYIRRIDLDRLTHASLNHQRR